MIELDPIPASVVDYQYILSSKCVLRKLLILTKLLKVEQKNVKSQRSAQENKKLSKEPAVKEEITEK
jgi:hypothetical protein